MAKRGGKMPAGLLKKFKARRGKGGGGGRRRAGRHPTSGKFTKRRGKK